MIVPAKKSYEGQLVKVNEFVKSTTRLLCRQWRGSPVTHICSVQGIPSVQEDLKKTRYGCIKNDWFDQKHFQDWYFSVALPYMKHQPVPRILLGDNLSRRLSKVILISCSDNNITFEMKQSTCLGQLLEVVYVIWLRKMHFIINDLVFQMRNTIAVHPVSWNSAGFNSIREPYPCDELIVINFPYAISYSDTKAILR